MGDDCDAPHEQLLNYRIDTTVEAIIRDIAKGDYLAKIMGGNATWSVASGYSLAVVAQQWAEPRPIHGWPSDTSHLQFDGDTLNLHFSYHGQVDPEAALRVLGTLDSMRSNTSLERTREG
jgi:hypothetical protein